MGRPAMLPGLIASNMHEASVGVAMRPAVDERENVVDGLLALYHEADVGLVFGT